jgi:hypothetical protein
MGYRFVSFDTVLPERYVRGLVKNFTTIGEKVQYMYYEDVLNPGKIFY